MDTVKDFQTIDSRIRPERVDDEIIISGISGKFPNARNMAEFSHNLYNKVRQSRRNCQYSTVKTPLTPEKVKEPPHNPLGLIFPSRSIWSV